VVKVVLQALPRLSQLMNKINPKKDADGDGKAGFMK
jgi:hypothetical protein